LKFGRARLKVVEINLGDNSSNSDTRIKYDEQDYSINLPPGFFVTEDDLVDSPSCRICFSEGDDDNPLICP